MMFIIRSPNPSHFSTHHHHHSGHFPDPCDGARDAMMLLHHLHQHAMQDDEKKDDGKSDQSSPDSQTGSKKVDKDKSAVEKSAKRTESSPSRRHRLRTFFQQVPVKQTKTKETATIAMDVPGFDTENLTIKLEDHILSVDGERKNRIGDRFVLRHRFTLDESVYDEDNIFASLSDGVLDITIQMKPEPKAKLIPIYSSLLEKDDLLNINHDDSKNNDDDDSSNDKHNDHEDATTQDEGIVVESVPEEEEEEEEEEEDDDEETKDHNSKNDGNAWEEVLSA